MPRNTRASKRKSEEVESTTPVKSVKKTPVSTPQSATKSRKSTAKKSPPSTSKSKPGPGKRKIEPDSGEEASSPSASPQQKRRDLRSGKPAHKETPEPVAEKKAAAKASTNSTSSIRRSKRQSTVLNTSADLSALSEVDEKESRASPQPKRAKESAPTPKIEKTTKKQAQIKTPEPKKVTKKPVKSPSPSPPVKKTYTIVEKPPLPRQMSREELYEKYIETLQDKLNRFDLSINKSGDEDLFANWPDSEVLNNIKKNPLLNRIWYSNEKKSTSGSLGEFNIASYDLDEMSTKLNQSLSLIKEEIGYIDADVFCIQNVASDNEKSLLSSLTDKKYTFSQPSHGCLIGYKDTKFTIVETKAVVPNLTLLDFIENTSYPSSWKDSLKASIDHPSVINSCPLVIQVLKHIESGLFVLLASQSQMKKSKDTTSYMDHRPDLNALNVTSIMWSIFKAWNELIEKKNEPCTPAKRARNCTNGHHASTLPKICWLFCGSLNACQESPIYQLIRDGYPCDETINRLRCIRPVDINLNTNPTIKNQSKDQGSVKKSLIDLLWHAFQHPQSDVTSCYADVVGREPPFTQIEEADKKNDEKNPRCNHYIWCSKSSLRPKAVLLTPCRALMSGVSEPNLKSYTIPLAAKIEIL